MNVVRLKITIYVIDVNKAQDKLFSQLSMEVNNTSYIHLPEQKKKGLEVYSVPLKHCRISIKSLVFMAVVLLMLF